MGIGWCCLHEWLIFIVNRGTVHMPIVPRILGEKEKSYRSSLDWKGSWLEKSTSDQPPGPDFLFKLGESCLKITSTNPVKSKPVHRYEKQQPSPQPNRNPPKKINPGSLADFWKCSLQILDDSNSQTSKNQLTWWSSLSFLWSTWTSNPPQKILPPNPHASNPRASWKHLPPAGTMRLLLKPETFCWNCWNHLSEKKDGNFEKKMRTSQSCKQHQKQHLGVIPYIKAIFPGRGARKYGGVPLDFHRENSTADTVRVHPYQKLQDLLSPKIIEDLDFCNSAWRPLMRTWSDWNPGPTGTIADLAFVLCNHLP